MREQVVKTNVVSPAAEHDKLRGYRLEVVGGGPGAKSTFTNGRRGGNVRCIASGNLATEGKLDAVRVRSP